MCDLCGHTGRYYCGEGDTCPCFFCEEEIGHLVPLLNLLYEPDWNNKHPQSPYGVKHEVETLLGKYVSTEQLIQTAIFARHNYDEDEGFFAKPKFPMVWLWNKATVRPKGAKKAHWEAYQRAIQAPRPAPPAVTPTPEQCAGKEGSAES